MTFVHVGEVPIVIRHADDSAKHRSRATEAGLEIVYRHLGLPLVVRVSREAPM